MSKKEGDKISLPPSVLSELIRRQAEIPWQLEIQLVHRKGPGKFEPVEVPAPPREVGDDGWEEREKGRGGTLEGGACSGFERLGIQGSRGWILTKYMGVCGPLHV